MKKYLLRIEEEWIKFSASNNKQAKKKAQEIVRRKTKRGSFTTGVLFYKHIKQPSSFQERLNLTLNTKSSEYEVIQYIDPLYSEW